LNAVIVNPVIILGSGDWTKGSSAIFKSAYDQFPWYTEGSSGFVDVLDVVAAMQALMASELSAQRYILSGANLGYRDVFNMIADGFGKKRPHLKVSPLLAEIVWRLEGIKSMFTGKQPLLTKEMLWILLPSLATLFLFELYFGRYKLEELGWKVYPD
jgi:nucleoside-diphosphate-sugar epimerase